MTIRDYRRQNRAAARALIHIAGGSTKGRTGWPPTATRVEASRLRDAVVNQGIRVTHAGSGSRLQLP